MASTRLKPEQVPTKAQLGLDNVDNTSDADKPLSTATAAAIDSAFATAFVRDFPDWTFFAVVGHKQPLPPTSVAPEGGYIICITGGAERFGLSVYRHDWREWTWLVPVDSSSYPTVKDFHWVAVHNGDVVDAYYIINAEGNADNPPRWVKAGAPSMLAPNADPTALVAAGAAVISHVADTGNPHKTSKAQVGLGNADNTSDAAKPVSTLQAAFIASALSSREDKANKKQAVDPASQSDYPSSAAVAAYVTDGIASALSTAFQREFGGEIGTGVAVIPDGSAPAVAGNEGDYYFTLGYEPEPAGALPAGWLIIAWEYTNGSWDFSSQLLPIAAKDLHWVAVRNGDEIHGYYVMGAGGDANHPPQWELIGAELSDYYTKSETDGAIAAVDAKADAAQGTANDAIGDAATAQSKADLAQDAAAAAQQTADAAQAAAGAFPLTGDGVTITNPAPGAIRIASGGRRLLETSGPDGTTTLGQSNRGTHIYGATISLSPPATGHVKIGADGAPGRVTNLAAPLEGADAVNKTYVDAAIAAGGGGGGASPVKRQYVAVVDNDGDDATGKIGRAELPFKTANAAFAAALHTPHDVYFDITSIDANSHGSFRAADGTYYVLTYGGPILKSADGWRWTTIGTLPLYHCFRTLADPDTVYINARPNTSFNIPTGPGASLSGGAGGWTENMFVFNLQTGFFSRQSFIGDTGSYPRVAGISANDSPVIVFANGNVMWVTAAANVSSPGGSYWWVMRRTDGTFMEVGQMTSNYDGGEFRMGKTHIGFLTDAVFKAATGGYHFIRQDGTKWLQALFDPTGTAMYSESTIVLTSEYTSSIAIVRLSDGAVKTLAPPGGVSDKYSFQLRGDTVFYIRGTDCRVVLHDWESNTWKDGFVIQGLASASVSQSSVAAISDDLYILQDAGGSLHVFDWTEQQVDGATLVALQFGFGDWEIDPAQVPGAPLTWPSRIHLTGLGPSSSRVGLSKFSYVDLSAPNGLVAVSYNNPQGTLRARDVNFSGVNAGNAQLSNCNIRLLHGAGYNNLVSCRVERIDTTGGWYNEYRDCEFVTGSIKSSDGAEQYFRMCRFLGSSLYLETAPDDYEYGYDGSIYFMNCDFFQDWIDIRLGNSSAVSFNYCRYRSGALYDGTIINSQEIY